MSPACRKPLKGLWDRPESEEPNAGDYSNPGLLLDYYLEEAGDSNKKRELLNLTIRALGQCKDVYTPAFDRWVKYTQQCESQDMKVKGRLIVGLGGKTVLETGITLHHTYGTPIIPGSALKGLASHYCHRVWGAKGEQYHKIIFGTTDDSGYIVFHDAWIKPEFLDGSNNGLVLDIMTPHHGDYYGAAEDDDSKAPTDFDDPNPIAFLSVTGSFRIAVSCEAPGQEGKDWAKVALGLLTEALRWWGAGGKTNAGYGRLARAHSKSKQSKDTPGSAYII